MRLKVVRHCVQGKCGSYLWSELVDIQNIVRRNICYRKYNEKLATFYLVVGGRGFRVGNSWRQAVLTLQIIFLNVPSPLRVFWLVSVSLTVYVFTTTREIIAVNYGLVGFFFSLSYPLSCLSSFSNCTVITVEFIANLSICRSDRTHESKISFTERLLQSKQFTSLKYRTLVNGSVFITTFSTL